MWRRLFEAFMKVDMESDGVLRHRKLMQSKEFQDELKRLVRMRDDFVSALRYCSLMSSRSRELNQNHVSLRYLDDLMQSAIAITSLLADGIHNPARRELRYVLESSVKTLYVDQRLPDASFDERASFLDEKVGYSVGAVHELHLILGEKIRPDFNSSVRRLYRELCRYVHPSKHQMDERVTLEGKGTSLGFETPKQLRRLNGEIFDVYDIVLVLVFHGLGLGLAGDVFVNALDDNKKWKFHKGRYIKELSAFFDYKAERKSRARSEASST